MKDKIPNTKVVLIVDDEDSEIYLAESIFRYMYEGDNQELIILAAYNSDDVIEFIEQGVFIDLVLMDISLPNSELNGIELVRKIREVNGELPPPVVGMLTTSGRLSEVEKSKAVLADFYLEKTEDIDLFEYSLGLIKKYYLDSPKNASKEEVEKIFTFIRD